MVDPFTFVSVSTGFSATQTSIQTNYGAFQFCLQFIFGKSYSPNILQIKMVIFLKKQKYFKIEIELPSLVLLSQVSHHAVCSPGLVFPILHSALHPQGPASTAGRYWGHHNHYKYKYTTIQYAGHFVF